MKKGYNKDEIINLLQELYISIQQPITNKILKETKNMPTDKVFVRLFGSWQNACKEANIPFERESGFNKGLNSKESLRLGEEKLDTTGCLMKVILYNNANDIVVEYQDENKYQFHTSYTNWKKSKYTNPYAKTIFNIGYLGNTVSKINGIKKDSYKVWYAMMQRCYKECYERKPTYLNCLVCDEWLCYENFEKWYNQNYYMVNDEKMHLDKDIIHKGNKIYSPDTCVFVPQGINKIFTKRERFRGDYPIGVCLDKKGEKYIACCNKFDKSIYLGYFNTIIEAFNMYKKHKEEYIKEVADLYKDQIPSCLYKALYKYQVEITD